MSQVVRSVGTRNEFRTPFGYLVSRKEYIDGVRCLNTDNHFVYRTTRLGSASLCTCGSPAVTAGYHAYKKYSSYIGNEVLLCLSFFQEGKHADGST